MDIYTIIFVNTDLKRLIFYHKNKYKKVYLGFITKHNFYSDIKTKGGHSKHTQKANLTILQLLDKRVGIRGVKM